MHRNVLRHVAAVFMLYGQFQLTTVRLSVPMLLWMRRLTRKWHWKWQRQIRTVMTSRWVYSQGLPLVQLSTQIPGSLRGHQPTWRPSTYRNVTFDALYHIGALLLVQILHCTEGIRHAFKLLHIAQWHAVEKCTAVHSACHVVLGVAAGIHYIVTLRYQVSLLWNVFSAKEVVVKNI